MINIYLGFEKYPIVYKLKCYLLSFKGFNSLISQSKQDLYDALLGNFTCSIVCSKQYPMTPSQSYQKNGLLKRIMYIFPTSNFGSKQSTVFLFHL